MTAGCVIRADSNADSNPSRHEGHDLDHLAQPYAQAGWWRMSSDYLPGPTDQEGQYSSEVQQRPHCPTCLASSRGGPGQRKQGYKRLLRRVRDEEVAGSNPVTPDQCSALSEHIWIVALRVDHLGLSD